MRRFTLIAATILFGGCQWAFGISTQTPPDAADGPMPDAALPPSLWTSVVGGILHTCGLHLDQTLWCWGRNDFGELGLGPDVLESDTPTQVGTEHWLSVSAFASHTCAVKTDNTLWCWGENSRGQNGSGNLLTSNTPLQVPGTWSAVATGGVVTCGLDPAGVMSCWGANNNGELGIGLVDGADHTVPAPISSAAVWSALGASYATICATQSDGSMWCWGYGGEGELGQNSLIDAAIPMRVGTDVYTRFAMGLETICALRGDRHLRCWGEGDHGEIGNDNVISEAVPSPVSQDDALWTEIAVAGFHACGLHVDGTMWCWGSNINGELAVATAPDHISTIPLAVASPDGSWSQVAGGDAMTCGISADHELWCAGRDGGMLGTASGGSRTTPVQIGMATSIAVGGYTTCAVDTDTLACWGLNNAGEVGDGTVYNAQTAAVLPGKWSGVATSLGHTCAIASGAGMSCWGSNGNGELGNNSQLNSTSPVAVSSSNLWSSVTVSGGSCGIANGNAFCWGNNGFGQGGQPAGVVLLTPSQVALTAWKEIATSLYHTCGINDAGVHCWGDNGSYELGFTGASISAPKTASAVTGTVFDGVTVGGLHSCVRVDGQYWCWGSDSHGELGNGSTIGGGPMRVNGLWAQLAAGDYYTCGVKVDGTLWCWGANEFGELGIGSLLEHHEPHQVGTDTDWKAVAAGSTHACALKTNQQLYCWGRNLEGQIGDGKAWRTTLEVVR